MLTFFTCAGGPDPENSDLYGDLSRAAGPAWASFRIPLIGELLLSAQPSRHIP
jgi:hypothetical protein